MVEKELPILRAIPSQIAKCVMLVGGPERSTSCVALLDGAEGVGCFREYRTFTGTYKGTQVTVCSHGVESAGATALPPSCEHRYHGSARAWCETLPVSRGTFTHTVEV